jgi:hypothetical protein
MDDVAREAFYAPGFCKPPDRPSFTNDMIYGLCSIASPAISGSIAASSRCMAGDRHLLRGTRPSFTGPPMIRLQCVHLTSSFCCLVLR